MREKEIKTMVLEDLKEQIIKTVNESRLSIDSVYYVMKDVMMEVSSLYERALRQEKEKANAEESAEANEETKEEE